MDTDTFVIMSYLPISNIMVPYVFSKMTISAYNFLSPIYVFFDFMMDSTLSTFPLDIAKEKNKVVNLQ